MRTDGTFIGIEIDDSLLDAAGRAALAEACPVDIFADEGDALTVAESNVDECILCEVCVRAAPPGAVRIHRLYEMRAAA